MNKKEWENHGFSKMDEREITREISRKFNFTKTNRDWNVPAMPMQNFMDTTIPLVVAEEGYKEYSARYGSGQTLERLGERGGFAGSELSILLFERIKRLEMEMKPVIGGKKNDDGSITLTKDGKELPIKCPGLVREDEMGTKTMAQKWRELETTNKNLNKYIAYLLRNIKEISKVFGLPENDIDSFEVFLEKDKVLEEINKDEEPFPPFPED